MKITIELTERQIGLILGALANEGAALAKIHGIAEQIKTKQHFMGVIEECGEIVGILSDAGDE